MEQKEVRSLMRLSALAILTLRAEAIDAGRKAHLRYQADAHERRHLAVIRRSGPVEDCDAIVSSEAANEWHMMHLGFGQAWIARGAS